MFFLKFLSPNGSIQVHNVNNGLNMSTKKQILVVDDDVEIKELIFKRKELHRHFFKKKILIICFI